MEKRRKVKNKYLILLLLLLFIIIFIAAIILDNRKEKSYIIPDFTYKGVDYKKKDNIDLLFFAGIDTFERELSDSYRNNYSADTTIMFVLDNTSKTITPIHINSEIICEYDLLGEGGKIVGKEKGPIYTSHTYGTGAIDSLINTKNTVRELLTRISVDYSFSLTMKAIPIVNDALNYVDVYIEDDFSEVDPTLIQNEVNALKGMQSLIFISEILNTSDETNISRMHRQNVYFDALFKKVKEKKEKDENFIADTYKTIDKYIVSNADMYRFVDLANVFIDYELLDSVFIEGDPQTLEDGSVTYIPNEEDIVDICIKYFYDRLVQ